MKFNIAQNVLASQANLTNLFAQYLSSEAVIIEPSTPGFPAQIRQRWTDYNAPAYRLGAIKPATDRDVQAIIRVASANDLPFFAVGGGHGISDYSSFSGLAIDLEKFQSVAFNEDRSRLTIGGSVKIHQLGKALHSAGRELPLGSCACVGVVGATLGGGIGGLQGRHGPLLDALESVQIVTPDGNLVTSSRSEHSDLFWGLRGAGANFGIVTSATYRLPRISNGGWYVNADYLFTAAANASFFKMIESFGNDMPAGLAINTVAAYNRLIDAPVIAVNAIYYGSLAEGKKYLEPFEQLNPVMSNVSLVPSWDIIDAAFFRSFGQDNGACTPNQHINIYSVALKEIHRPTFESFFARLVTFWKDHPTFQGRWLMQRYSNLGPCRQATSDSAYGYRQAQMFMNFEGFYEDRSLDEAVNEFWSEAREAFSATSGYPHLAVYPNYARGDEGAQAWYGSGSLPRLIAIKRKYDPKGLFSVNNPIPLIG